MRSFVFKSVLLWFALSGAMFSFAANSVGSNVVIVGAIEVPYLLEKEGKGEFYDLIRMIVQETGLVFDVRFAPGVRVREWFNDGLIDVFMPAIASSISTSHLASSPFFVKEILVFTNSLPVPAHLADLQNKVVGYTRGYSYRADLLSGSNTYYQGIGSDRQSLLMLHNNRLDVFLGEKISVFKTIEEIKQHRTTKDAGFYYIEQPISSELVYFAFQSNAHGAYLKEKYESALESLRQQGKLKPPLF